MKKINIAVIGLGRIGWGFHCLKLSSHKDFNLIAAADPAEERLAEAEKTYGVRTFPDYKKLLKLQGLDAVVIASPTHMHHEMALASFKAGLHVLLEKPMASDSREAVAILKAARSAKKALTIFQPHRGTAYFLKTLELIKSGEIGKVCHVRKGMFGFNQRNDWQSLKKYSGGMLNNYGSHSLDQIMYLTGDDVRKVFCSLKLVASIGDADDVVKIVYETKNGVIGEVDINQASVVDPYELIVWGTRGVIEAGAEQLKVKSFLLKDLPRKKLIPSLASRNRLYPSDKIKFREKNYKMDVKDNFDIFKDFAASIRTGKKPYIKPEEVITVLKMIERCRKESGTVNYFRIRSCG